MKAQDLKNSILQLAIQGKLVEQREEEGTAKELIEKIQVEKERLIKEGKIKKTKLLPEITEDEKPFDIPESWEWVKLEQLATITGGYAFKSTNYTEQGVRVIRISDFNERGFVDNKIVRHPYDDSLQMFLLEKNNILLCMTGGTVGKSLFVKEIDEPMMTNQRVATIKISHSLLPEYINYIILSSIIQNIIRISKNSTNDNISMDTIKRFPIPLPPLEEQKRIVAKIEELMPYVDQYDKAYTEVEELNKKFPEDMQKSILQYAIQGKLVEQREEDGTAEDLYKQIQAEKEKLIKEKKIKKTKALPDITEDEITFDIPENWKWVRLEQVCEYIQRGKSPKYSDIQMYPVVAQKCNQWSGFSLEKAKFIDPNTIESYKQERILQDGDLMWNSTGLGTLGRVAIYEENKNPYQFAVTDSHVTVIRLLKQYVDFKYLYFYIANPTVQSVIEKQSSGSTKQIELGTNTVKNYILPLPPLEEQKRIVEKIEELLPYTKQLVKKVD
ncbi:restriction endonuclease subunit S [Serpentinicella sp. ANB-PHB4]|uniref:restriction endonuclease subunit S n=1 Tax=Serpentinicella sp. ANB-PHB4 TaxID=3074076 RepID=UPI00285F71F0|nr:restriction endonuclease subunit S [Serpentinicella sp. ANB-PHB4]MDR5658551.1 restriction endonuclease subunit S [Serpentinicella sp. ANB-PHB4]